MTLVDSGAEAARAAATLLRERGQLAPAGEAHHRFFLSDEPRNFVRIAQGFLGRPLAAPTIVDETDVSWFERTHPSGVSGRAARA